MCKDITSAKLPSATAVTNRASVALGADAVVLLVNRTTTSRSVPLVTCNSHDT